MKKLFSIKYSDNGISFAALLLRMALGIMMLPHGFSKLMSFATRSGNFADPFHIGPTPSLCLAIFRILNQKEFERPNKKYWSEKM